MYWSYLLSNKIDVSKIITRDWGLYTQNKTLKFYKPKNRNHVSHSLLKGMKSTDYTTVNVKDLQTIMQEFGHNKIDLLKLDIEGAECDVIDKMLKDKIFPKYISIDFDLGWTSSEARDKQRCLHTISRLQSHESHNYDIIHKSGADYSFQLNE